MQEQISDRKGEQPEARQAGPSSAPPSVAGVAGTVLRLQATAGNRAVSRSLRPGLPSSSLRHAYRMSVQRAVATWGGTWDTTNYAATVAPRVPGVTIDLTFSPNKKVNATQIALTQALKPMRNGAPSPVDATAAARAIPAGKPGAGTYIDQLSNTNSPIYAATPGSTARSLRGTTIVGGGGGGRHAFRFTDDKGKVRRQTGLLNDSPARPGAGANSGQVFETTAVAISGEQVGAYYGSVQWGWQTDAAGTYTRLPLTMVSWGAASDTFSRAAARWNRASTVGGAANVDLPTIRRRFTANDPTDMVDNPASGEGASRTELGRNVRVQVTDLGRSEPFNTGAQKWWKVVVGSGTHTGRVGWVLESALSTRRAR